MMPVEPVAPAPRIRLPLTRPRIVYIILGMIALTFVLQTVQGGSTNTAALERLGAQVNLRVAQGEMWRLLTAMFLHIGLMHLAFNSWALFSLGRDIEAFYGSIWFVAIYFIAGMFGNLAYYLLGGWILSAGASGGVFGLIGAEVAFFLRNRRLFGKFGRERLSNLAVLIGINLVFGFTVQGINNYAHIGGLLAGLALGFMLAPRYEATWVLMGEQPVGMLRDRRTMAARVAAVGLALALLAGGVMLGNQRWASTAVLREQASNALSAGGLTTAQGLLEQAVGRAPADAASLRDLGVLYLYQEQTQAGVSLLERAQAIAPDDLDVMFYLAAGYANMGRLAEARPLFEQFLWRESSGQRAQYARQVLAIVP